MHGGSELTMDPECGAPEGDTGSGEQPGAAEQVRDGDGAGEAQCYADKDWSDRATRARCIWYCTRLQT